MVYTNDDSTCTVPGSIRFKYYHGFRMSKYWMSIHLPFKTQCKLLASTDNWHKAKRPFLDSTLCMPINAVGGWLQPLEVAIPRYHHDISWQGQGQETTILSSSKESCWCPIFVKETAKLIFDIWSCWKDLEGMATGVRGATVFAGL